jgi:hypothetical protein
VSYRGRLLNPFLVELEQLDTATTEDDAGYDPVWRTVKVSYPEGVRTKGAAYQPPIRVRAQVEVQTHRSQQQSASGNVPNTGYLFVLHFRELEARGLLDPKGEPTLRVNDRVVGVYTLAGDLVQLYDPPLYLTEVQTTGFGIGRRRNLCILSAKERAQGVR